MCVHGKSKISPNAQAYYAKIEVWYNIIIIQINLRHTSSSSLSSHETISVPLFLLR